MNCLRPASAVPGTPTPPLQVAFDAAVGVYADDAGTTPCNQQGQRVAVWRSGNVSFAETSNTARPYYQYGAQGLNGFPCLRFAGGQRLVNTATLPELLSINKGHVFAVCQHNMSGEVFTATPTSFSGSDYLEFKAGATVYQITRTGYPQVQSLAPDTSVHLVESVWDGSSLAFYIDGFIPNAGINAISGTDASSLAQVHLGALKINDNYADYYSGKIAYIGFAPGRILSSLERERVREYLAHRFNLEGQGALQ